MRERELESARWASWGHSSAQTYTKTNLNAGTVYRDVVIKKIPYTMTECSAHKGVSRLAPLNIPKAASATI